MSKTYKFIQRITFKNLQI